MKKRAAIAITVMILTVMIGVLLFAAYRSSEAYRKERAAHAPAAGTNVTEEGVIREYSQKPDGTWACEGHIYKYRLEITGRIPNAAADSTFVYLSNLEEITFGRAWKAAGLSSNTDDYFDAAEAVLVEMRTENG